MKVTKENLTSHLLNVQLAVKSGEYQISQNEKNNVFVDYVFTEENARKLILSLNSENFVECDLDAGSNSDIDMRFNINGKSDVLCYTFRKKVELLSRFGDDTDMLTLYIKVYYINDNYCVDISFR